jgi:YVTN family beta-propeller protein
VLAVPELGRVYAAATDRDEVAVIDAQTLRVVTTVPGGDYPDGLAYDPVDHRVSVSDEHGGADDPTQVAFVACERNAKLLARDLHSGRTSPTVSVGDVPDVLAYDSGLHRLYVAAESGTLAVFQTDGMSLRKVAQGFAGPNAHTVAVDPATHRVFLPLADDNGRPVLRVMAPDGR